MLLIPFRMRVTRRDPIWVYTIAAMRPERSDAWSAAPPNTLIYHTICARFLHIHDLRFLPNPSPRVPAQAEIKSRRAFWVIVIKSTALAGSGGVGPVGASSTLAACVRFGVLFGLLMILRVMVCKLRQTENRKGNRPMTNNNRKMIAACTLDTIWGVGISAASATLLT